MSDIVHILRHGVTLCGMSNAPATWPRGNVWVGPEDTDDATCARCINELHSRMVDQMVKDAAPKGPKNCDACGIDLHEMQREGKVGHACAGSRVVEVDIDDNSGPHSVFDEIGDRFERLNMRLDALECRVDVLDRAADETAKRSETIRKIRRTTPTQQHAEAMERVAKVMNDHSGFHVDYMVDGDRDALLGAIVDAARSGTEYQLISGHPLAPHPSNIGIVWAEAATLPGEIKISTTIKNGRTMVAVHMRGADHHDGPVQFAAGLAIAQVQDAMDGKLPITEAGAKAIALNMMAILSEPITMVVHQHATLRIKVKVADIYIDIVKD